MLKTPPSRTVVRCLLSLLLASGSLSLAAAPADAAALLIANLVRADGEDPTVPGTIDPAFVAIGDARLTDQGLVRVDLKFLDAARFPVGTLADVRIGGISASVGLTPFAPEVLGALDNPLGPTTAVAFKQPGSVSAGDRVELRIRSEFVVNGVRQRHETRWAGTLAAK